MCNLVYNKIFRSENSGFHNRFITVSTDYKVETSMLPLSILPLLAKELSDVAKVVHYQRINPFRFDTTSNKHVYIEYGSPNKCGYEIIRKQIIRKSNKGNFKIPSETFLFDLIDYFVEIELLDKDYNFISNWEANFKVIDNHTAESLLSKGFKFPQLEKE